MTSPLTNFVDENQASVVARMAGEHATIDDIAAVIRVTAAAVRLHLRAIGIKPPRFNHLAIEAGIPRTRDRPAQRNCLSCDEPFRSDGWHNRICKGCKARKSSPGLDDPHRVANPWGR